MLYVVTSLALALSPKPASVLMAASSCDSDFTACTNGVHPLEAKLHHIKTLKETSGVLTATACTGTKALVAGSTFQAKMSVPMLGDQVITLAVDAVNGAEGTGSIAGRGVAAFTCKGVTFQQSGSKITLHKALHEHCPSLPSTFTLSNLEYCAEQKELHATVATPYVDLHVAAQADFPAGLTNPFDCPSSFTPSKDCCNPMSTIMVDGGCGLEKGSMTVSWSACTASAACKPYDPSPPPEPFIPNNDGGGGDSGCFAKDSTTACLLASPAAECQHVLMSDLAVGDLVLGREGATTVVAVQHKAVDTTAEMLTFHTASGAVSMTPDHAVFANGELVAAAEVKVGSLLSSGAVKRVTKSEGGIINAVTASGTIVADGVLAASNPMWIASLTVDAPITRAVVNAALYAAGDVDTVAAGFGGVVAKISATLAVAAVALRARKASA